MGVLVWDGYVCMALPLGKGPAAWGRIPGRGRRPGSGHLPNLFLLPPDGTPLSLPPAFPPEAICFSPGPLWLFFSQLPNAEQKSASGNSHSLQAASLVLCPCLLTSLPWMSVYLARMWYVEGGRQGADRGTKSSGAVAMREGPLTCMGHQQGLLTLEGLGRLPSFQTYALLLSGHRACDCEYVRK